MRLRDCTPAIGSVAEKPMVPWPISTPMCEMLNTAIKEIAVVSVPYLPISSLEFPQKFREKTQSPPREWELKNAGGCGAFEDPICHPLHVIIEPGKDQAKHPLNALQKRLQADNGKSVSN